MAVRVLPQKPLVSRFIHFLILILFGQSCVNNTNFEDIQHLNDIIIKDILTDNSSCLNISQNLLDCFSDTQLELANRSSLSEVKYYKGDLKDSYCISYKTNNTLNGNRYFFYVYVSNVEEFNKFEYYEQFRDGLISSKQLNDNWLLCKMTNNF